MDIVNVIYEYAVVADDTIFYQSKNKTEICNAIMELQLSQSADTRVV